MAHISNVYAEALFELAFEEGKTTEYSKYLGEVCDLISENPEYVLLLDAPSLSITERKAVLEGTLGEYLPDRIESLLMILCEERNVSEFSHIAEAYRELVRASEGVVLCKVTSAVELAEEEKRDLGSALGKKLFRKVELTFETDPSLIGGVVIEADGNVYDGSLRKKLTEMKEVIKK